MRERGKSGKMIEKKREGEEDKDCEWNEEGGNDREGGREVVGK